MRATKHTHISSLGNLSITSSDKKEKKKQQQKNVFAKVQSLVVLSQLTALGPDADQHRRKEMNN